MLENPRIDWDDVKSRLRAAATHSEIDAIHLEIDRLCYGRIDVNRIDRLVEAARDRLWKNEAEQ